MTRRIRLQALSSLILLGMVLFIAVSQLGSSYKTPLLIIVGWAFFESVVSFLLTSWALVKSNQLFFSVFLGGSLVRLLSIGLATWILMKAGLSPVVPLLVLVGAYFAFSLVQIPFYQRTA